MKKHPIEVEGFDGDLQTLAHKIAGMRYDKIEELLYFLEQEFMDQSRADEARGRIKLSSLLFMISHILGMAKTLMHEIFLLCQPYMKEEINKENVDKNV